MSGWARASRGLPRLVKKSISNISIVDMNYVYASERCIFMDDTEYYMYDICEHARCTCVRLYPGICMWRLFFYLPICSDVWLWYVVLIPVCTNFHRLIRVESWSVAPLLKMRHTRGPRVTELWKLKLRIHKTVPRLKWMNS